MLSYICWQFKIYMFWHFIYKQNLFLCLWKLHTYTRNLHFLIYIYSRIIISNLHQLFEFILQFYKNKIAVYVLIFYEIFCKYNKLI